jgi:hypothetical protein
MLRALSPQEYHERVAAGKYLRRTCTKCGLKKYGYDFHKGQSRCKVCRNKENADYRAKSKEQIKQYKKTYREKFPDRVKESQKKYRDKNASKFLRYKREFYFRHGYWADPENTKERGRKYRREHPEIVKACYQRYKGKKQQNGGRHTTQEWRELVEYFEYKCVCCGARPQKLEKDHIVPVSKGGSNSIDNMKKNQDGCAPYSVALSAKNNTTQ